MIQFTKNPIVEAIQAAQCTTVGQVVTDAEPPAVPEFLWDFIEKLSLGPFSPDDHRGSVATGPDNDGIIREAGVNVPVFPGARVVTNKSDTLDNWLYASATATSQGDGSYLLEGLLADATNNSGARLNTDTGIAVDGRTYEFSAELKAVPGDEGKEVRIRTKRATGGTTVANARYCILTDQWQRFVIPPITGITDNLGWISIIDRGISATAFNTSQCLAQKTSMEDVTGQSNDAPFYIPELTTQHFDTTNANTVDANGIVTENPGVPIDGIKGLQLEGERTNEVVHSNDWGAAEWSSANIDVDGAQLTATGDPAFLQQVMTNNSATYAAAFDIKRISGTGDIGISADGSAYTVVSVTTEMQRFWLPITVANIRPTLRIYTIGDVVEAHYAQAEVGAFPSSRIPTTDSAVTRAATKAIAPFTSIPELPDEGLVNDFCGQIIFDPSAVQPEADFLSIDSGLIGSANNRIRGEVTTDGVIELRIVHDGISRGVAGPQASGDIVDFRFLITADRCSLWVDGANYGDAVGGDMAQPLDKIVLGANRLNQIPCFGAYSLVRLVPEALSDEEIEGW